MIYACEKIIEELSCSGIKAINVFSSVGYRQVNHRHEKIIFSKLKVRKNEESYIKRIFSFSILKEVEELLVPIIGFPSERSRSSISYRIPFYINNKEGIEILSITK